MLTRGVLPEDREVTPIHIRLARRVVPDPDSHLGGLSVRHRAEPRDHSWQDVHKMVHILI